MLVQRYQDRVNNIVYSLTNKAGYADDISQEVFIKIYQKLGSFRQKSAFSTWLYRITVNTTYNYLKKEKRYVPLDDHAETLEQPDASVKGLDLQEKQELIKHALIKLPFNYRSVIIFKDIEGLSYKEIAQSLGCRLGTVESRLFRARNMLRKIIKDTRG